MSESPCPRSTVPYADDCIVKFVGHNDNTKAQVDTWQVVVGASIFRLEMMRMKNLNAPWVFGSIKNDVGGEVWKFRTDPRVQAGFAGDVYTKAFEGNRTTWVFFESRRDRLIKHVLPLVELLMPSPGKVVHLTGRPRRPRNTGDEMTWFIENVLDKMGKT